MIELILGIGGVLIVGGLVFFAVKLMVKGAEAKPKLEIEESRNAALNEVVQRNRSPREGDIARRKRLLAKRERRLREASDD